ncbi:MAG: hypothetical protein Q8O71_03975 [bacterium]|nr:hypothetical protein [bacterium]
MFTIITKNNVGSIATKLIFKRGYILIAEPGTGCPGDICIKLFRHPKILGDSSVLSGNLMKDRGYLLRVIPTPSEDRAFNHCRSLFSVLTVGFYQFKIHYDGISNTGVLSNRSEGVSLYVPSYSGLGKAFSFGLQYVVNRLHYSEKGKGQSLPLVTKGNIEEMVAYALDDLRTGKVFQENISAGQEADSHYEKSMQERFLNSLRS